MIVPISAIQLTCHLALKYSQDIADSLTLRSDCLQLYKTFFINLFATYFMYKLMQHWGQDGMPRREEDEISS